MVDTQGRIPEEFIQSLLSRVDIVEVIGNSVPLRKSGSNYVACCPFHKEKTPSFSVNATKQFYHCFGCGVSGDAIQFIIEHDSLSFVEAIELLAAQHGMQVPVNDKTGQYVAHNLIYNMLAEATKFFEQQLRQHTLATQAVEYLKDRGLTGITAKRFKLGFAPSGWDNLLTSITSDTEQKDLGVKAGLFIRKDANKYYDRFRNRIMFPIHNSRGRVIGFGARTIGNNSDEPKYLNSPETSVFSKSHELYGYYEARQAIQQSKVVIVVEGYMDVVSLSQAGITNAVATLGTACTEHHVQYLFKVAEEIVFCFDGDAAGKKAAWRSLELCLPLLDDKHRIKFLLLPFKEDPDSYVRKNGLAAMQAEIKQAATLSDFLFDTLAKQVDLEHVDGRAQFAAQVKQYLNKMPDIISKTMLFDRLAQQVNINPAVLQNQAARTRQHWNGFSKTIVNKTLVSPAMRTLALLLVHRELIEDLPDLSGLENLDIGGCKLLYSVCNILRTAPQAMDAEVTEQLAAGLQTSFKPQELRAIALTVPDAAIKDEFLGAIALLRAREKELVMDKLLLKAKQNVLSQEDKLLLQQMLRERD